MGNKWIKKLNELRIRGEVKRGLFRNKKEKFIIRLYITPKKEIIVDIDIKGNPKFPFSVGDNLSDVYKWVESNSYESEFIEKIF